MSDLKWSDPSPPQSPPGFRQARGLVLASTLADGGECRIALEQDLNPINLNGRGDDASAARTRDASPRSVREFFRFEHGAGI
jgi:hypothetical protein